MVVLGGWVFLVSEVPLQGVWHGATLGAAVACTENARLYRGTSLIRNTYFPMITIGP